MLMKTPSATVVIIDPLPLLRFGLGQALGLRKAFKIVGEGATAAEAKSLAAEFTPDLLFVGVTRGGVLETAEAVLEASPRTKVIVVTDQESKGSVERGFQLGIRGYVVSGISPADVHRAAEIVMSGDIYLSQQFLSKVFEAKAGIDQLASCRASAKFGGREEEILHLLCQGMSNKAMAYKIGVGEKTIKYYLTNIMKKIEVKNRVEVALYASRRNDH